HGGEVVAPMAGEMNNARSGELAEITEHGIGHYTRVYGTRPVDPVERAAWLWQEQRRLVTETRLGIPALVHEECLTGLAAWPAATTRRSRPGRAGSPTSTCRRSRWRSSTVAYGR